MDIKTLCLGALTLGDATGYEIKKQFEEGPFSYFHQASFGSIYPSLGQLSEEGLVTCTKMPQDSRPDKKVYSITPQGVEALKRALRKNPSQDKIRSEYMTMFFLADFLEEDHLREIYDDYLAYYRSNVECLTKLDDKDILPNRRFTRGFGLAFYQTAQRYMEENRHLLFGDERAENIKTGTKK
ncbi:MAG: PadR family transcriptional regulator, partial [Rhodospirillales bacterium]|nr:PadR family transcriptional regulator [Rhodospirillales bacterium]